MTNIIEVNNLSKSYGDIKAVNNISFNVERGSLFAFLGLNGAGKSTTINILCQILNKDEGEIIINGYNLSKEGHLIKPLIGIVFQTSVLDYDLTVYQNLRSRASLYNMPKQIVEERIDELIKLFDLSKVVNIQYKKLSGGQKRRVDIARALINRPKILFLDEPTTGLDPNTRILVWDIINYLIKSEDLTVFLTTHYMEEVIQAHQVVIIDEGEIVASGTPDKLKEDYASDILRIISARNEKIDTLFEENKITYTYERDSYKVLIENSLNAYEIISLSPKVLGNFEVVKGNMDQVFLNVTGKVLEEGNDGK